MERRSSRPIVGAAPDDSIGERLLEAEARKNRRRPPTGNAGGAGGGRESPSRGQAVTLTPAPSKAPER